MVKKRLVLTAVSLAMLLVSTAALAQTESGASDEVRCLLLEGCGPVPEDQLLCLLPEGCDTNGDGVPDLGAGDPVQGWEAGTGTVQYDSTP